MLRSIPTRGHMVIVVLDLPNYRKNYKYPLTSQWIFIYPLTKKLVHYITYKF
jgi:hypothetical protein